MSGIVGIINLDGQPVEQFLLQKMTVALADQGPDASDIWLHQFVGLGHTLLQTTIESQREQQPYSIDGEVWITADARIDGKTELREKLKSAGYSNLEATTDVDLILYAYHCWGGDCVQHLIGDFSFGIWDQRQQSLFCARDHFGVKPFYYADLGNCFLFSNTLDCLWIHPTVTNQLNELAIADFLLFDLNQDPNTTIFADIRRLPAGHSLTVTSIRRDLQQYWTLPTDGYTRYRNPQDYIEHFQSVMRLAVSDRLRNDRIAISMSGGLDSTSIAAIAKQLLAEQNSNFDLQAYTVVCERMIPDQERHYADLVARFLNISINYLVADDYPLFYRWDQPELRTPEPCLHPFAALTNDHHKRMSAHARVALSGNGGDPVLLPSNTYFWDALKRLEMPGLLQGIDQYFNWHGHLPPVGLRTQLRRWLGKHHSSDYPYPTWLNPDFVNHLDLTNRWKRKQEQSLCVLHPHRHEAYHSLSSLAWSSLFESSSPGATKIPLEIRYPYFDVRVVKYLLSIPPFPWCVHKFLLRVAMDGSLPPQVLRRPKTPLPSSPLDVWRQHPSSQWLDNFIAIPVLNKYVNRNALPAFTVSDADTIWINLRPVGLNQWLHQLETNNFKEQLHAIY